MLVYSTLDVMAALDRPVSSPSRAGGTATQRTTGIGQQFTAWVAEFMKPTATLKAKPEEIWAWRNGLVHSYSFESDATRTGRARRAYYCYGSAQLAILRRVSHVREGKAVPVKIEHLIAATKTAIERFQKALAKDPSRAERVHSRVKEQFYALVRM